MAYPEAVKVEGLDEFRRQLKAFDDGRHKMVRVALNEAGGVIVEHTVPWIPRRTGRTARSVRVRSTQTKAVVVGGSARVPWYPFLDFGGSTGRGHERGKGQGSVKRQRIRSGRYTWRTLGKRREQVAAELDRALRESARSAGLVVTDGG